MTARATLAVSLALAAAACQGEGALAGDAPGATVLARHPFARCPLVQGGEAQGLVQLERAEDWSARVGVSEAEVFRAPVDWSAQRVLVVTLGTQPSGGHALALPDTRLPVRKGVLEMAVTHQRPGPDAMVTQALTSPCLFVQVQRAGWSRVALTIKD